MFPPSPPPLVRPCTSASFSHSHREEEEEEELSFLLASVLGPILPGGGGATRKGESARPSLSSPPPCPGLRKGSEKIPPILCLSAFSARKRGRQAFKIFPPSPLLRAVKKCVRATILSSPTFKVNWTTFLLRRISHLVFEE